MLAACLPSLLQRLFGFKRPIAHALFLVARCEAALLKEQSIKACQQQQHHPVTIQAEFKRPTLLPATLTFAWRPPAAGEGDVGAAMARPEGLPFAVLTADGSKEVLVGKFCCGPEAGSS